jgi:hypothetical protein
MKWSGIEDKRLWIFRILVVAAVALMLVSFSMPWWVTDGLASEGQFCIKIYGYGLQHNMGDLRLYILAEETPIYETAIAWIYIIISAWLALLSTWISNKKGTLLLSSVGLCYIIYTLVAIFVVVSNCLEKYEIAFQGATTSAIYKQMGVTFSSSLQPGFYIAIVAGLLFIILAFLKFIFLKHGGKTVVH